MFAMLDRFGLPVKYAILGVCAGIIWLIIASVLDYRSPASAIATLAALGLGGFVGGLIRQKQGKDT
ncbi:MAG: hypothetical protein ACTSY1_06915 [Alphaproteobacteria bacterium]